MAEQDKTVKELRETLKGIISNELDNLPETLENMEPKQRLNIVIKLLPYALPKTDSVTPTFGESLGSEWDF